MVQSCYDKVMTVLSSCTCTPLTPLKLASFAQRCFRNFHRIRFCQKFVVGSELCFHCKSTPPFQMCAVLSPKTMISIYYCELSSEQFSCFFPSLVWPPVVLSFARLCILLVFTPHPPPHLIYGWWNADIQKSSLRCLYSFESNEWIKETSVFCT